MSLKSKQLLIKVAQLMNKKKERISKLEIQKKLNQIKYLTVRKDIPRHDLKKEIIHLEKQLQGIFLLESRRKIKEATTKKESELLKKQIKELKQRVQKAEDPALRKKVDKLSHLIGEVMAKESIKKEIKLEQSRKEQEKGLSSEETLRKIKVLQERILNLKNSGKYPPEKIEKLLSRLTQLEQKLGTNSASTSEENSVFDSKKVKHNLLFSTQPTSSSSSVVNQGVAKLEQEIEELPLPPPPKIRKKK